MNDRNLSALQPWVNDSLVIFPVKTASPLDALRQRLENQNSNERCGLVELDQAKGRVSSGPFDSLHRPLYTHTQLTERTMYDLSDKVALVTGAGGKRGIGRAIALRLAAEGADVVVNDIDPKPGESNSSDRGVLDDVVREIRECGRRAVGILADVADATQVDDMVRQATDCLGCIDILINNAASPPGRDRAPVVELDEDAWDLAHRVNVRGTFLCCRAVARRMIDRDQGGKIINISSSKGKRGAALHAAYASSKFAIIGFTESLALELAPRRINVNAVCPGMVDTDRISHIVAALTSEDISAKERRRRMLDERSAEIPLGRVAQRCDVAATVAFLASAESDYLTGLAISVTGGTHMW